MQEKKPFLQDEEGFGISRTSFRRLRRLEKREAMVRWFYQNFEDPAVRTPYESREGGYQWIWGGPDEAADVLGGKFGGLVSDALITEVVEEVEREGLTDWAPIPKNEDYAEIDPPDLDEPLPLEIFLDEPSAAYGEPDELAVRAEAIEALDLLSASFVDPAPIGIGHNNPPADDEVSDELKSLREEVLELRAELAKPAPSIGFVKRWAKPLRDAVIASARYAARKVDKAIDTAITVGTSSAVVAVAAHYSDPLHAALNAVIKWLEIAAQHLF